MYYLEKLLGTVVTVKTDQNEIVAKLIGYDEESNIITLEEPRMVVIQRSDVVLVPFVLTATSQVVHINMDAVLTVLPSLKETAKDFLELVDVYHNLDLLSEEERKNISESVSETLAEETGFEDA